MHRRNGVLLQALVDLSPVERESLKGAHLTRRLAEKTAKAYRDKAKYDEMMRARVEADAKKFEKAQKSLIAMNKQVADLQEKLSRLHASKDF